MNKNLKIGLITAAGAGILYGAYRFWQYKNKKNAGEKFQNNENDVQKKILINQVLIFKRIPVTDENINSYMQYSVEELSDMLEPNTVNLTDEEINDESLSLLNEENIINQQSIKEQYQGDENAVYSDSGEFIGFDNLDGTYTRIADGAIIDFQTQEIVDYF